MAAASSEWRWWRQWAIKDMRKTAIIAVAISVCEVRMTMHGLTRFYIYLPGRIGKEACDQHRMMFAVHFHDGYVRRSPCDHARSLQAEYAAEGILAKL